MAALKVKEVIGLLIVLLTWSIYLLYTRVCVPTRNIKRHYASVVKRLNTHLRVFAYSERVEIKQRLRELRKSTGLTQQQIADKAGIGFRTYQDYELGRRTPNAVFLGKLAEAFNVPSDYLLGKGGLTPEGYLIALSGEDLNKLTDEQKQSIKSVIEQYIRANDSKK